MTLPADSTLPRNLAEILADLRPAAAATIARRTRSQRRRRVLLVATACVLALGVTAAASGLLGSPAPPAVKDRIAAVDAGMPADLRLNPEVENARLAAIDGSAHLYVADVPGGGHCLVIVTAGRDRGVPCTRGSAIGTLPIDVSVASDTGGGPDAPVVIGGRINDPRAAHLALRFDDGAEVDVPLADGRFFVYDVPGDRRAAAHGHSLTLVAADAEGRTIATEQIPADWNDEAVLGDGPIREVLTRSDESDLTRVLGLDGSVDAGLVSRLELTWPDGTTQDVPFGADGTFGFAFPAGRVDDLARAAATVVAYGPGGEVVARQEVASVAETR